ncbi:translation initiation factor [Candidatus Woesearchaeota archaeon]|nr:translation initiation factor [Candidatus Woesearchaeota archaeon]
MSEICSTCGLPKELCVCETIAKESQEITIGLEKKKFGKTYTVVRGVDGKEIDINDLTKKLKSKLACGGTTKEGRIELQGNHAQKTKEMLLELGFSPGTVIIR